jgi:hypothetical protein
MIDSVLKGTGNSRFLKSAVPAGTSWADALAMLQAGTFPIDFNGINAEGFQQVGTPLNKANLLKDATAAQIGLPPSTTPDGMFQALGNTGELHVWRKTVKNAADIPAGYTLEAAQSNLHVPTAGQSIDFVFSASITVGDDGTVSQPSSDWKSVYATDTYVSVLQSLLAGKFFTTRSIYATGIEGVWYCPSNLTVSVSDNDIILSQAQKVNAHGIIPAGTTSTYPVSTNPNAYQESDDAKAAGYTLGEVETGKFVLGTGMGSNAQNMFYISSSVTVDDSGNISQENQGATYINGEDNNTMQGNANNVIGKFVVLNSKKSNSDFDVGTIWYIPPDATIGNSYLTDGGAYDQFNITNYVNKRQPVTGYAAIPAGTTIEYLGKLGDKARVQVVSYVGTGTYGEDNPCSISVDFPMKAIVFLARVYTNESDKKISTYFVSSSYANDVSSVLVEQVPTTYSQSLGLGNNYYSNNFGKRSKDRKSYYWYNTNNESDQGNFAGTIYYFLVIG